MYERGIRGFLKKDENGYVLSFQKSKDNWFAGVFYKEIGTDFNNGIFKYICGGGSKQVRGLEDQVKDLIKEPPNINVKEKGKSLLHSQRVAQLGALNEKTVRTLNGERRTVFVMKKKRFAHLLLLTLP